MGVIGGALLVAAGYALWNFFTEDEGAKPAVHKAPAPVQAEVRGPGTAKRPAKKAKAQHGARRPSAGRHPAGSQCKNHYQPLKKGTTFLVDTANLVGELGPEHVAERLTAVAATLEARGYRACFFWEHRSFKWARRNQLDAADVAALEAFARRKDVSIVGEESDLAILQAAQAVADSVIVTQDHLRDYAAVYPDLVGTSRHRAYSLAPVGGRMLLTIYGLREAIEIPPAAAASVSKASPVETAPKAASAPKAPQAPAVADERAEEERWELDEAVVRARAAKPVFVPDRKGLLGVADACLARGEAQRAFALIDQVARKQPKLYHDIANAFANGQGVAPDVRKASHYDGLADRREKALRERRRRNQRLVAEHRRTGMLLRAAA